MENFSNSGSRKLDVFLDKQKKNFSRKILSITGILQQGSEVRAVGHLWHVEVTSTTT